MNKEPCFICLNEKDKSKYLPLISLTNSKNCKCNSRVHVKCYKKYNNYQKNKCPMCNSFITSKTEQETELENEQETEQEIEAPYYYDISDFQRHNFFGIFYINNINNNDYHRTYTTGIIVVLLVADIFMGIMLITGLFILIKFIHMFIICPYF